jgi:hypothetical protein
MVLRLVSLVSLAVIAVAQYGSGVLLGTVTDTSGAVVAGARVVARNVATKEVREFTTDSSGNYQFNALPTGNYVVTVTATSFKQARIDNLTLRVNTQLRADVGLQVGTVTESIDVEAVAPLIQTNTAAVGMRDPRRLAAYETPQPMQCSMASIFQLRISTILR